APAAPVVSTSCLVHPVGSGPGDPPVTVTVTPLDVVRNPPLSVATAVSVYVPAGTLLHVAEYGADVSTPIDVLPLKNSTCAIEPSESDAFALREIVAGAEYV